MSTPCAVVNLAPFMPRPEKPWTRERLLHLFERAEFGLPPDKMEDLLQMDPGDVVQNAITTAQAEPLPDPPPWANWALSDYSDPETEIGEQYIEWQAQWVSDMMSNGLRERVALMWHNHFVTQLSVYNCPSYMYSYHRLLQEHGLGNFKTLTLEMGKNPAMLVYLNGVQNTRFAPNENYARELFELFTLGRDIGYTQQDITEAARALTGWNGFTEACADIGYTPSFHDNGIKTIFGVSGNFDYEGLHDLLFTERAEEVSKHACRTIYRTFINHDIDEDVIGDLATTMRDNNFEIAPVVSQLLSSEFFFDSEQIGTQISSPIDALVRHAVKLNTTLPEQQQVILGLAAGQLNQSLFDPPSVAGWPGDRDWINSSLLTLRWDFLDSYTQLIYGINREGLGDWVRAIATHETAVEQVCRDLVDFIMPWGLGRMEDYASALDVFKSDIPENYFERGEWSVYWDTVPDQAALLIQHLTHQPEFQLK
jgi:uncharacterized protein (DUF1800 family)